MYGSKSAMASCRDIAAGLRQVSPEQSVLPEQARSRQCAAQGCGKRPVFNLPGEKLPIWCQAHKAEGMVDVLNRLCTHPGKPPTPLLQMQKHTQLATHVTCNSWGSTAAGARGHGLACNWVSFPLASLFSVSLSFSLVTTEAEQVSCLPA